MDAAAGIALAAAAEGWYFNLWNSQSDEEQATAMAEWEETIAKRAEELAAKKGSSGEAEEEDAEEGEDEEGDAEEGEAEEGEGEGDAEEGEAEE